MSLQQKLRNFIQSSQRFVDRLWYPPLLGVLAALDAFVLIVPTDGLLISSTLLLPRRWFGFAFAITIGSTVGAVALAGIVEWQGLPFIQQYFPRILNLTIWAKTEEFFKDYGLWVVFVVALLPIIQQPAILLAGLANENLTLLTIAILIGRLIKYSVFAYISSHAPKLLNRFRFLKSEIEDAAGPTLEPQNKSDSK